MAQTHLGAMKVNAKRLNMSLESYLEKLEKGFRYCNRCKQWKTISSFGKDCTRYDGKARSCLSCGHVKIRKDTKGYPSAFKGKKHTPESRQKMREAAKRRRARGEYGNRLGIQHTVKTRIKISKTLRQRAVRGTACHSYKDGKTAERRGQRHSMLYKRWRFDVFSRDQFTCQDCGDDCGGNLVAHHIKPFADFPELRFEIDNGITLCEMCHKERHT